MGYPSAGSVNTAQPINVFVRYYAGYLQDDIRVNNKLTVNVGLRYEYETGEAEVHNNIAIGFNQTQVNPISANVTGVVTYGVIQFAGVGNNPTACCKPSKTKFGPRAGAAYQLTPKTILRAGIGIFYAPTVFGPADSEPGFTQTTTYVASTNGNATPANSLNNPFPSGIIQPSGNTQGALTSLGSTFSFLDPNKAGGGTVYQYSADIQGEAGFGVMFEVGYIGSRSTGLTPTPTGTGTLPINELSPANLALGQAALNQSVPNPFYGQLGAAGVIGTANITRAQLLLPFPEYSTINENTTLAHARYDSLVAKVQKRFSKGLQFLSTFTWARSEDNEFGSGTANALNGLGSAGTGGIQNIYNLAAEWALAAADNPIRWSGTWIYQLPFGKNKPYLNNNKFLDWVVGG